MDSATNVRGLSGCRLILQWVLERWEEEGWTGGEMERWSLPTWLGRALCCQQYVIYAVVGE